jgi:hypothetical protein
MFGDDSKGETLDARSFSQVAQLASLHARTWCIKICFI